MNNTVAAIVGVAMAFVIGLMIRWGIPAIIREIKSGRGSKL